jgi:hypothetical protein
MAAPQNKSEYILESVLLESERLSEPVELKEVVTDIDIFESLDKPYLTGQVLILDNERLYENADLLGAEKITIKIKSIRDNTTTITNNFYISKIINTEKVNNNMQILALHLVEDIAYYSNLININKVYRGKCSSIISKIIEQYLNHELGGTTNDKQNLKLIVPNLSPIEAIKWITSRATSLKGYPFYCYSTFALSKLYFNDLGGMLSTPVINQDLSYKYNTVTQSADDPEVRRRTIKSHKFSTEMENLTKLIVKGLIGAKYEYIDTNKEYMKTLHFDIKKDLFNELIDDGILNSQANIPFSEKYLLNEKSFNKLVNRSITQLRSNGAFEYYKSYGEEDTIAGYKLEIISRAMDNVLKKNPMTIVVPGVDFIDGDKHSTIGNNIRVEFQNTKPDVKPGEKRIDTKKSGDYLIYQTRHMFKKETYEVALTCVKIGNYRR